MPALTLCYTLLHVISLSKYLWDVFYVPDALTSAEDIAVNSKDKNPCPHGAYILKEEKYDKNK